MAAKNVSYSGLDELAWVTGVDRQFLRSVIERSVDPYHEFQVPKGGAGKFRTIAAPLPDLARVQRWILDRVLVGQPSDLTWLICLVRDFWAVDGVEDGLLSDGDVGGERLCGAVDGD